MELTKLDSYDYILEPGAIRIKLSDLNDPILVDIFSELERSDNEIYLEGNYYTYVDRYGYIFLGDEKYLQLEVTQHGRWMV